jgi:hypothetical protein
MTGWREAKLFDCRQNGVAPLGGNTVEVCKEVFEACLVVSSRSARCQRQAGLMDKTRSNTWFLLLALLAMSTDTNSPSSETLEFPNQDCVDDITDNRDDVDYDYEPPIPYDFRHQWADRPVEWALSYAANQIRQFDRGLDFYRNLNPDSIETWVFDVYPELLETLRGDNAVEEFLSRLARYCRMLQAAALLANEVLQVRQGLSSPLTSALAICEEFFPGWLSTIQTQAEWRWQTRLPGPVAELYGKWHASEYTSRHHSDGMVGHSEALSWDFSDEADEGRENVTAYLLERDSFPLTIKACTDERLALVVRAPAGTDIAALTRINRTALAVFEREAHRASWDLSFGRGILSLPVLKHEDILLKFRNHVPVIFHFDGKTLLAEYDWNPIAFGHK